jgi:putative tryptophan/tyrosine transport system substrate-binding protein
MTNANEMVQVLLDRVACGRLSRRQHHGLHQLRTSDGEQMARTPKGGRASGGSRCDHIQPANGTLPRSFLRSVETAGPAFAIQPIAMPIQDAGTIEKAIEAFAHETNPSRMVLPDVTTTVHEKLIVKLAAQHRLPAIYPLRHFVTAGGLMGYAADLPNLWRRAASYVDRVLKGEKPADLPVQQPTKFELVINLTTAKGIGLTIPASILSLADDLIE